MTEQVDGPLVEFLWRPGCGFCARLKSAMDQAGVSYVPENIWESDDAAARVRAVANGNEVVPTVFVNGAGMVNPSLAQVQAAIAAAA